MKDVFIRLRKKVHIVSNHNSNLRFEILLGFYILIKCCILYYLLQLVIIVLCFDFRYSSIFLFLLSHLNKVFQIFFCLSCWLNHLYILAVCHRSLQLLRLFLVQWKPWLKKALLLFLLTLILFYLSLLINLL